MKKGKPPEPARSPRSRASRAVRCANYYKILAGEAFPRESGTVDRPWLRASVLLLPTVAVGLVGYFWFMAPDPPRLAAKLWLLPAGNGHVTARAFVGSFPLGSPPAPGDVELMVAGPGLELRTLSRTSADGVADFSLQLTTGAATVKLKLGASSGYAAPLVAGSFTLLDTASWIKLSPTPELRPKSPFDDLMVELRSGVVGVPFLSQVKVHPGDAGCFTRMTGAEVVNPEACCVLGCLFYPTEHVVELELGHTPEGKLGTVLLPVVPGAMPASVVDDRVYVYSATPRRTAHLAWITEDQVLGLASVSLSLSALPSVAGLPVVRAGTPVYWGAAQSPALAVQRGEEKPLWLVTSSEPDFVSAATVAWPLGEASSGLSARFAPLAVPLELDGFAQQRAFESERGARRRRQLTVALGGLLVAEVTLLWLYVNRAQADMGDHLPRDRARLWWLVITCLVLGFGGMIALFWWK